MVEFLLQLHLEMTTGFLKDDISCFDQLTTPCTCTELLQTNHQLYKGLTMSKLYTCTQVTCTYIMAYTVAMAKILKPLWTVLYTHAVVVKGGIMHVRVLRCARIVQKMHG